MTIFLITSTDNEDVYNSTSSKITNELKNKQSN